MLQNHPTHCARFRSRRGRRAERRRRERRRADAVRRTRLLEPDLHADRVHRRRVAGAAARGADAGADSRAESEPQSDLPLGADTQPAAGDHRYARRPPRGSTVLRPTAVHRAARRAHRLHVRQGLDPQLLRPRRWVVGFSRWVALFFGSSVVVLHFTVIF